MILNNINIFIVEDNPANAGIVMTTLQMQGASTHFDRWGTDTVEKLKRLEKIDIILMDLMLANDISGYDVFDQIKTTPELMHIPIVVVSASDATFEMEKARQRGFAGDISKPINFRTFPETIARILHGEAVWADQGMF